MTKRKSSASVGTSSDTVLPDDLDEYASAVVGLPPRHFNELIEHARKLMQMATAVLYDKPESEEISHEKNERVRDILLLAAYAISQGLYGDKGESPLAFVTRAKQVVKWCTRPLAVAGPLGELENKAQEIARQVARRLFRNEGFLLLIFDEGPGHVTWVSSAPRRHWIELAETALANIKADQARRS
jgi:hypothetical protein